jgi:hypothetical protein
MTWPISASPETTIESAASVWLSEVPYIRGRMHTGASQVDPVNECAAILIARDLAEHAAGSSSHLRHCSPP